MRHIPVITRIGMLLGTRAFAIPGFRVVGMP
jgi:hypothetical protein